MRIPSAAHGLYTCPVRRYVRTSDSVKPQCWRGGPTVARRDPRIGPGPAAPKIPPSVSYLPERIGTSVLPALEAESAHRSPRSPRTCSRHRPPEPTSLAASRTIRRAVCTHRARSARVTRAGWQTATPHPDGSFGSGDTGGLPMKGNGTTAAVSNGDPARGRRSGFAFLGRLACIVLAEQATGARAVVGSGRTATPACCPRRVCKQASP